MHTVYTAYSHSTPHCIINFKHTGNVPSVFNIICNYIYRWPMQLNICIKNKRSILYETYKVNKFAYVGILYYVTVHNTL